ncbi:unnamed protein product, partial [Polarella glacialis]
VMGSSGAFILLLQLFMAVTSTGSAEIIAVSSILTYDMYYTCLNPELKGRRDGLRLIFQQAVLPVFMASPYTVFAPIDAAFADLLKELGCSAEQLLANPDLKSILLYHVVGGSTMSSSLKDGQKVTTAQSGQLAVQIAGGKVKVGRATVTAADIECSNGVIHVIDKQGFHPVLLLGDAVQGGLRRRRLLLFFGSYIQNDGACYSSSTTALTMTPARALSKVMGSSGAFILLLQLFMAVTSTGSAEIIAVSSILTYDIYYTCLNPELKGRRDGLRLIFQQASPYTVFAPIDAAFADLLKELGCSAEQLLANPDLKSILLYHVVGGSTMSSSLKDGQKVTTAQSGQLAVQIAGGKVKVGRATVTAADIECSNGVIHVIDKVLRKTSAPAATSLLWARTFRTTARATVVVRGKGRAMTMHPELGPAYISAAASGAGLTPARFLSKVMGSSGAFILLLQLFMTVTSTGSAEIIAVSSILTYDIYYTYLNPELKGRRDGLRLIFQQAVLHATAPTATFFSSYVRTTVIFLMPIIFSFTVYASPGDSIGLYGSPSKASIQSFFSATQSKEDLGTGGYFSSLGSYIQNNGACYSSSTTALEKSCSFKKLAKDEWCCSSDVAVTGDGHHCRASTKDFIDVSETQHFESSECDFAAGERCVTSFLTMGSPSGLLFGIANIVGNFGTVFVDQSYWQSAVAANPKSAVKGFLIGGLVGFAAPFCMATTTGLAGRALTMHPELGPAYISAPASGAGLTPARVLSKVMAFHGRHIYGQRRDHRRFLHPDIYDIYYTCLNPELKGRRDGLRLIFQQA